LVDYQFRCKKEAVILSEAKYLLLGMLKSESRD